MVLRHPNHFGSDKGNEEAPISGNSTFVFGGGGYDLVDPTLVLDELLSEIELMLIHIIYAKHCTISTA